MEKNLQVINVIKIGAEIAVQQAWKQIMEGFKTSIEKRGLIYSIYIVDGDSSVYKKIIQANSYSNVFIEKIECRNHLLRNLASKIKEIAKTRGCFGKIKNVIGNRVLRIRTAVTKAVE